MAKLPTSGVNDQAATLRQLKTLVVVLVLSNIALGVFCFFTLRTLDRRYSDLIGRSVPLQNDLQTITALAVSAMHTTNPALFDNAGPAQVRAVERGRAAVARELALRTKVLRDEWMPGVAAGRAEFEQAGEAFGRAALDFLNLIDGGATADAVRLREEKIRPAFDRYLSATTHAADLLQVESLRVSDEFSAKTGSVSTLVLGFASWPVLILAALLILTAVFVIVLMLLFRGREMSDMP
jgi:hypothetical protein